MTARETPAIAPDAARHGMARQHRSLYLAAFYGAMLFAVVMAILPHPPAVPGNPIDKAQHATAFVTLALLAALAYPAAPLRLIGERLSFLGALIEVVQSIPALHRDCDIMDWIVDTLAIGAMLLIVRLVRDRRGQN